MNHEAQWYQPLDNNSVQCMLCPHACILKAGKTGICRVRNNSEGKLMTEVYGFVSSLNFDPIEKKPLFHFYPGSSILSIGSYGCNLRCFFCQNCSISQSGAEPDLYRKNYTPDQIVQLALDRSDTIGIAFTYNEPTVWFEYMFDIAKLAKESGLKTVMVTNGYINREPLANLLDVIDAFSVDLKAFSEDFYTHIASAKLKPVKKALKQIHDAGKHLEVVNLVIPGLNDDETSVTGMIKWISSELGKETVLHISRYYPHYKLAVDATPIDTIRKIKHMADKELLYVYTGNLHNEHNNTYCLQCNNVLISRFLYNTKVEGLNQEGNCNICGRNFLKKL